MPADSRTPLSSKAKERVTWRGYTSDMTDEAVIASFRHRYGVEPKQVRRETSIILAGPVPTKEKDSDHVK